MITREDVFGPQAISLSQFSGKDENIKQAALDEIIDIGLVWANSSTMNKKSIRALDMPDGLKLAKKNLKNHIKMVSKSVKPSGFLMSLIWPFLINQLISFVVDQIIKYLLKSSQTS
jgi:hypothetical protein